jgi:hypothetical protein
MVPASGETSRIEMPSVAAALGGGSLPSWICQKNADLSMQVSVSLATATADHTAPGAKVMATSAV